MKSLNQITLCLLLLCGSIAMAQENILQSEYSHRRYSISDGLPENYCWNVYQDSKGYIWTATYNGFARYDGQQFTSYWHEKQTNVQNVTENREGHITALSYGYYAVLDPVADTLRLIYHTGWRLIPYMAQNMPAGYFFYESSERKRVALFQVADTALVKIWEHACLAKMDDMRKPYWDRGNRKFYIPAQGCMYIVDEATGAVHDSIAHPSILTVFPYGKSIGALGTDGIYRYENRKWTRLYEKTLIPNPSGLQALTDSENRLLIRDVTHIYRFDGNSLEYISGNAAFFNILFDTENNLWTATYEGLFNLFQLQFRNYAFAEKTNFARTICADDEKVWIGTYEGHVYHIKNDIAKEAKIMRTTDSYFQGFSAKAENHLFFPGGYINGDVLHFDGKKAVWMNLPTMDYSFALPLPEHQILLGSYQGVVIYDYAAGKVVRKLLRDELYLQPACAALDKKGRMMIGGSAGITVMDGDSIYLLDNMPEDFLACRAILTDKTGKLWASSSNSKLFSVDGDSLKHEYTFEYPIRGIYVTEDNLLIVLTLKGVHIKKSGYANFIYYDRNNGFTGEKIPPTQLVEDTHGNIWFLADKSIIRFHPHELLQKQSVPTLHVRQIMTSTDNVNWTSTEHGVYRLGHRNNNIRFQYIGINYSAVENVRYHYRLRGFQGDWSEPSKNREITFNNLPQGDYVFEIYADSGTDESRCDAQSFAFTITPAFWQTAWFMIICIASLILVSAGVALYVQRRKNRALLEKLRAEKELNELRISSIRLKAIPHFNANVLSAIEYYIANRTKEDAMRILGVYSDFTFKTLSEVDKASRPLDEELAYVKMYLDLEKIRFLDKFDFRINVDKGVDNRVQLPNMILHTYCENAVKHGLMPLKSGGMLTINVSQNNRILYVVVEDNGVGRTYAAQNPQLHSTKQGLTILNRQIEIYNRFNREKINQRIDDLSGTTGEASGTRFTVEVPTIMNYEL